MNKANTFFFFYGIDLRGGNCFRIIVSQNKASTGGCYLKNEKSGTLGYFFYADIWYFVYFKIVQNVKVD